VAASFILSKLPHRLINVSYSTIAPRTTPALWPASPSSAARGTALTFAEEMDEDGAAARAADSDDGPELDADVEAPRPVLIAAGEGCNTAEVAATAMATVVVAAAPLFKRSGGLAALVAASAGAETALVAGATFGGGASSAVTSPRAANETTCLVDGAFGSLASACGLSWPVDWIFGSLATGLGVVSKRTVFGSACGASRLDIRIWPSENSHVAKREFTRHVGSTVSGQPKHHA
jgi:hypothetical protein